ncbi:MAG: FAD-binding oxidoreductase [Gammaproteobacteria bacterium]|nr:FAD-binding oxidoreductase [Gammaproteobacteria bacterium]
MRKVVVLLLLLINPISLIADNLTSFTTDGCSVFPDGTVKQQSLWLDCCIRHDLAYWVGGSYQERQQADLALENCVAQVGEPEIARIMLAGVRAGGSPYFPTSYRWGYGWPYPRGYQQLSEQELTDISNKIRIFIKMVASISDEINAKKLTNKGSE